MLRHIILFIITILVCASSYAATEKPKAVISHFVSNMTVNNDSSIDVVETISVYADERHIRHGIVRWLPTNYLDGDSIIHPTQYVIQQVLINNTPSPFQLHKAHNHYSLHTGHQDIALPAGNYTFVIKYHITNAINLLREQDKLFWNTTGGNWDFPILKADITLQLPSGSHIVSYSGETGKIGTQGKDFTLTQPTSNQIAFTTTKPLLPGESFIISLTWPKGFIQKTTEATPLPTQWKNHLGSYLLALCEAALLLIGYCLLRRRLFSKKSIKNH